MKSLSVGIQIAAAEGNCETVHTVYLLFQSLAIQMKTIEQYFPVALVIMLYKVVLFFFSL